MTLLKRVLVNNDRWFDSLMFMVLGSFCGAFAVTISRFFIVNQLTLPEIVVLSRPTVIPIVLMMGVLIFANRTYRIASSPLNGHADIDFTKLGLWGAVAYIVRFHWLPVLFGIITLIFVFGLVPSAATVLKAFTEACSGDLIP